MTPDRVAVLLIDWQERLFGAMPEAHRDRALRCATNMAWIARELEAPVLTSEQYPRGLGHTLPSLEATDAIEKVTFSAIQTEAFARKVHETGRDTILLTGMETHICVAQTARDLLAAGLSVYVVADAVLSRRTLDWRVGLDRMVADGARLITTEAAMFELIGRAGTPLFKEVSRRIK